VIGCEENRRIIARATGRTIRLWIVNVALLPIADVEMDAGEIFRLFEYAIAKRTP
jgi:hypothetical protein